MSMPVDVQPPPPLLPLTEAQPYFGSPSIGPLIGVLVVILVLGIVAAMIGRLCTGRRVLGYGHYDLESWIETKCSSCIDGRIHPPPQPPPPQRVKASSGSPGSGSLSKREAEHSSLASQSKQETEHSSSEASPATQDS